MKLWAVVTTVNGRPVEVDGPYLRRDDARDIKRQLDLDDQDEGVTNRRAIVVPMGRFLTSAEFAAFSDAQADAEAAA